MQHIRHASLAASAAVSVALAIGAVVASGGNGAPRESSLPSIDTSGTSDVPDAPASTVPSIDPAPATTIPAAPLEQVGSDERDEPEAPLEPLDRADHDPPDDGGPADDDHGDHEPVAPDAGQVTGSGAVLDQPVHPEPPTPEPPAPTWSSIPLDVLNQPDPAPAGIPVPTGGPIDQIVSNAPGCASTCITKAVLTPKLMTADMDFEMITGVPTQMHVWVLPFGPLVVDGMPVFVGKPPMVSSEGMAEHFTATLGPLAEDSHYRIVVLANDGNGGSQVATTGFWTESVLDEKAAGTPCQFECIVSATVQSTNQPDMVRIDAEANATATFEFFVSTSEPGTIAGHPFLPADQPMSTASTSPTTGGVWVYDLAYDTTYHVVVKATDESGNAAWAAGSFHTDPAPPPPPAPPAMTDVWVGIERLHVRHDGDNSAINKGEIQFDWLIGEGDGAYAGHRAEQKIDDGTSIDLPIGTGTWVSIADGGTAPRIVVNARESDMHATSLCAASASGVVFAPSFDKECDATTAVVQAAPIHLHNLDSFPRCSEWGLTGAAAEDTCLVLQSGFLSGDYVDFDVLVRFHVAD